MRCGSLKPSYDDICPSCGHRPEGEGLLVAWLLSDMHLHRDELARAVVGMVGAHGELLERRCHALRALGSRAGLGFLRECLEHSDAAVRRAAEGAWRASTQLPPPPGAGVASRPR